MTRWEVTKAVRKSDLPAPSRLIMLTLADSAETGTAEIPPSHTPSIAVLARETGLGKSTVKEHLAALEVSGWLMRTRPDKKAQWAGERTCYRLDVPRPVDDLGQDPAETGPGDGREVGQEPDSPRPGPGHQSQIRSDQIRSSSDHVSPTKKAKPKRTEEPREDVDRVCKYLAEWVVRNGSKPPTITDDWRREARLLIDRDGRPLDEIRNVIRWCQTDAFWRKNVLSVPTLRKQYDRLRLSLDESPRPTTNGHRPYRNPADMSVYEEGL